MAIDIDKQIKYWQDGALESLKSAKILIEKGRNADGLFFCHLAMEKALKAHVAKKTSETPPKTHNLVRLFELSHITADDAFINFLGELMGFQ